MLHAGLAIPPACRFFSKQGVCNQTDIFFDSLKFYKTGSSSLRAALHYSVGSRARMEHTDLPAHAQTGICGLMETLKNIDLPPRIAFVAVLRDPIDRLISALNFAVSTTTLAFKRKCCTRSRIRRLGRTIGNTYDCSSAAIRRIPDCALHASSRLMPWSSPGPDLNSTVHVNDTVLVNSTVLERFKACAWHRPCGQMTSEMMIQQAHACALRTGLEVRSKSLVETQRFFLWPIETYAHVFQPAGNSVRSIARYMADNFVVGTTQNMSQLLSLLSRVLRSDARATTECTEPYFEFNPKCSTFNANVFRGRERAWWADADAECTRDELSHQTISELAIKMSTDFGIYRAAKEIFEKQMAGALPLPVHDVSTLRRQYSLRQCTTYNTPMVAKYTRVG